MMWYLRLHISFQWILIWFYAYNNPTKYINRCNYIHSTSKKMGVQTASESELSSIRQLGSGRTGSWTSFLILNSVQFSMSFCHSISVCLVVYLCIYILCFMMKMFLITENFPEYFFVIHDSWNRLNSNGVSTMCLTLC